MLFLPGTPIQRLFPGWHRRGMMTYITTGAGGGAGLGFASAGLCTLFAFTSLSSFPSALLEQNLSQPTQDVGGESRLGKYRGLC